MGRMDLLNSQEEALNESEDRDQFRFQVRYNPGRCDSPVFEAFLKGRWIRTYIDTESNKLRLTLEQLTQNSDLNATVWANGKLTESTRLSPKRIAWPVLIIVSFVQRPPTVASVSTQQRLPCSTS